MGRTGDVVSKNRYVYVKNNPLKYVDPTGEEEKKSWLAGLRDELSNIAQDNRIVADYFRSAQKYGEQEGGIVNRLGAFTSGIVADIFENTANIYDPSSSISTRSFAFGLIALDVGSGGSGAVGRKAAKEAGEVVVKKGIKNTSKLNRFLPAGVRSYDVNRLFKTQPSIYTKAKDVRGIKEAILEKGPNAVPPIVIHIRNGRALVVDGHHRLEAFMELGFGRIPIKYVGSNKLGKYGRNIREMEYLANISN